MTITTRDQLIDALGNNSSRIVIDKASLANAAAAQFFSLWTATGQPGAGANPGAAVIPTNATTGAIQFTQQTPPATSYWAWLRGLTSNANQSFEIHDRLAHMGGLSGIVTTPQNATIDLLTLGIGADRRGDANYSDTQWWIEVFVAMGATAVNATVNVTYDDASTQNLAVIALGATPRQGRMYPLISATAGRFIRGVNTVTLSASTLTAGNFGITCSRQRVAIDIDVASKGIAYDWAQLGLPEIPNASCLFGVVPCSTTATGTIRAQGKIAHG